MNCVYILRCADESYYTGWTNDLTARLAAHNRGTAGAKYTRARRPVQLVYCEVLPDKSAALKREAEIKKMSRAQKQNLIESIQAGERLTVYDADEMEAGVLPRAVVHRCGIRHHVCHLWLVQERAGVLDIGCNNVRRRVARFTRECMTWRQRVILTRERLRWKARYGRRARKLEFI